MSDNAGVVTKTLLPVNGIDLCADTIGEPTDPALLLIAGAAGSMDGWDDEFCRRLAAGGRYVVRYDHRDTGRSTAGSAPYSGVDLAHDALGVLDALGLHRAHLVGHGMGADLAERVAIERPHRVLSLTLICPGDVAPPDEAEPDWSDRRAAVRHLVAEARRLGGPFTPGDPHLRRLAERVHDRTTDMAAARRHHVARPATGEERASVTAPTLVLHGTLDPVVPAARAEELAAQIPGARLVRLEGVGHEMPPPAVWAQVIAEIIDQAGRRTQPA